MAKIDPRQPEFWNQESLRLLDELSPFVLRMLLAGAQEGEAKLPPELRVLIDWDKFNDRALDYLRGYNFELIKGITETTRKATVKAIDDWVQSGAKFDVLIEKLNPVYGKARAQRIAVTEVTRVFAEGNTQAWKATGMVSARKWYTAQDERVCPICGPMHNKQADIGQPFYTRDGQRIDNPPAHPKCLPGDSLVLPIGGVASGSERVFEGYVSVVETAKNDLTVTPNHPILTRRGWVIASEIVEGDYIAEYSGRNITLAGVDNQNVPSAIHDIFYSLGFSELRVPTASPDFHGDGMNGDIAVIRPNCEVLNKINSSIRKEGSENLFVTREIVGTPASCRGPSAQFSKTTNTTPDGIVSGLNLGGSLFCTHGFPLDRRGLGLPAWGDAVINEMLTNNGACDSNLLGELIFRDSGSVQFGEVTKVRNNYFSGHVYNLQTESGLFVANGIITHNCRCFVVPVVNREIRFI